MSWTSFIQNGKISQRFLLPIICVSGCVLFLPPKWQAILHINKINDQYSQFIGPLFLISLVLLVIDIMIITVRGIERKIRRLKVKRYVVKVVMSLTHDEKSVLREFYLQGKDTLSLPYNDPTILGLISKRIIFQIGNSGDVNFGTVTFSFSITDVARKYISPFFIDLPLSFPNMTEKEIDFLKHNRPSWIESYRYF